MELEAFKIFRPDDEWKEVRLSMEIEERGRVGLMINDGASCLVWTHPRLTSMRYHVCVCRHKCLVGDTTTCSSFHLVLKQSSSHRPPPSGRVGSQ
jgi:hypothetical protein